MMEMALCGKPNQGRDDLFLEARILHLDLRLH
jgi:hypothetical protein